MVKVDLKFGWRYDDENILGDFYFICSCGHRNDYETVDLEDFWEDLKFALKCEKCGKSYRIERETWMEEVTEQATK